MKTAKLPISALLPIYNCRERLERHLRSVITWANTAEEIIVVDSGSTDGSLELAKEVLKPFGAQFLHNPPGLYQSWNAGIAAATAPWCYISTVEDPISQEGLSHLLEVVTRHDADVVISPPEMRNHDGSAPVEEKMPSNRLAEAFYSAKISDRLLNRAETISMLCGCLPSGLLGSSASNLYRTSFLQHHPFPTDFGHCGDTAWGVTIAPIAQVAFTAQVCAQFYCQTVNHTDRPVIQLARHKKLAELARQSMIKESLKDSEVAAMLGAFESQDHLMQILWNWLAEEDAAKEAYRKLYQKIEAKYEGGIIHYFCRAIRDELKKF